MYGRVVAVERERKKEKHKKNNDNKQEQVFSSSLSLFFLLLLLYEILNFFRVSGGFSTQIRKISSVEKDEIQHHIPSVLFPQI